MSKVLLLHGWGFPAAVFSALRKQLPADILVHSSERPGYGQRQGEISTHKDYQLDSPVLVIGWSLGSQEAMRLALEYPQHVTGLVLLAATPRFVSSSDWKNGMDAQVFNEFRVQVEQDTEAAMNQFVRLNSGSVPDRETRSSLNALKAMADTDTLLAGLDELEKNDLRSMAREIDVPVLLLHAADDRVVPVAAGQWLAQAVAGARLVEYRTGGHAFFIPHAEEIAGQIEVML